MELRTFITEENGLQTDSIPITHTDQGLQSYSLASSQLIVSELENLLSKTLGTRLHPLLRYALLSKGKRLRPILVFLSAQSVGGNLEKVTQLALSFELLHTATLVHDDIIDEDTLRRGTETLHSRWSVGKAILAGDALIALSINLAADYGTEVMKILSNTSLELCEGEYLDLSLTLEDAIEKEYFLKIKKKSASLFRAAAYCGALVAGGESLEVEALSKFGENFGIAYQLSDDLSDLLCRDQVSQDLKNGNVTLPLLYLYQHGDEAAKELLRKSFGNRNAAITTIEEIRDKMKETEAFEYCKRKIEECKQRSQVSLRDLRESVFKDFLMQFSDYVNKFEA